MDFNNYYLWYLLDRFGFIIDEIQELTTFTKHTAFEKFVIPFMNARIQEGIKKGNKGVDKYTKMILNAGYGKDGTNPKNYDSTLILNTEKALLKQSSPNFISNRQLAEDLYLVQMTPQNY
jgi:hypothetical protein